MHLTSQPHPHTSVCHVGVPLLNCCTLEAIVIYALVSYSQNPKQDKGDSFLHLLAVGMHSPCCPGIRDLLQKGCSDVRPYWIALGLCWCIEMVATTSRNALLPGYKISLCDPLSRKRYEKLSLFGEKGPFKILAEVRKMMWSYGLPQSTST